MPIDEAWQSLIDALAKVRPGCMVVVSPTALRAVLEERLVRDIAGEADDQ